MATNGSFIHQEQYKAAADQSGDVVNAGANNNDLSKDEVGWYFVEQYYTTLSKSPDRLHLFYNKRSQFVSGIEAEVANVSVGRQAIQDRIKKLDFQDTKVRVSNVDSQASSDSIVIQVIGEISNKAAEPKKFVQTFVLAQQPTGYFVLNDMMRYIDEESDETTAAASGAVDEAANEDVVLPEPVQEDPVKVEESSNDTSVTLDTTTIEQKLEEVSATIETPDVNGGEIESPAEVEKPSAPVVKIDAEAAVQELQEEDVKEPEKPQDPSPTPIEKPSNPLAEPALAEPAAPPKPMTWASRAAAAAGPRPVVPLPKTQTPPAQAQNRAPAPAAPAAPVAATAAPAPAPATAAQPPTAPAAEAAPKDAAGWQTAGADSKRQNRPQSVSAAPADKEGTLGYVKYVTDKVQEADLKKALETHGDLAYFDINRQKNCAFVEYKTSEALTAALASNPHVVSGEQIVIEQRRPKSLNFGGNNFGGGRGGSQRGRGGFDGNRAQGNARGNFGGQNRGRGAPRGRGAAQTATA